MPEETVRVPLAGQDGVTAILTRPQGQPGDWLFIYAPGAGSNVHDGFGAFACRHLAAHGFTALRFQFPDMEARRRRPDRPAVLQETWTRVVETFRASLKLVIGGRSMGGRIASQIVAQGTEVDALALFAYPLHAPGPGSQWRDQHLPAIGAPTLFCSGTRDAFATPEELRQAASGMPQSSVHILEGADHGFATLKSGGRTREEVWAEAVAAMMDWLP